jgi:tricorn protease
MKRIYSLIFLACILFSSLSAETNLGYYRSPSFRGGTIVFHSQGTFWKVPEAGGSAVRLTSDEGAESLSAISPDGKLLAYTGEYEGVADLYLLPLDGGPPKRLTYDGVNPKVVGWHPEGKLLFTTTQYTGLPSVQVATLNMQTKERKLLPLSEASDACFDDKGKTVYFTRYPFQGSSTKRYKGGFAQNIWKYTESTEEALPLTTDYLGTSKAPMYWDGRVYFLSDRDGILNIWSMNENGKDLKQHTFSKEFDVLSASTDQGKIIYEMAADLHMYSISTNVSTKLPITLTSDFNNLEPYWVDNPMTYLSDAQLSPTGDKEVLTIRGNLFVAEIGGSDRRMQIPKKNDVQYREGHFFREGKSLIAFSDDTGEWELREFNLDGSASFQLTQSGKKGYPVNMKPSPNSKFVVYADTANKLWLSDLNHDRSFFIDKAEFEPVMLGGLDHDFEVSWSPDSQWLAYTRVGANTFKQIMLFHVPTLKRTAITSDRVNSFQAQWSPDGEWIACLSQRNLSTSVMSPWGVYDIEPYLNDTIEVYITPLQKDGLSPFNSLYTNEEKKDEKDDVVTVDFDGILERIERVPIPASNYKELFVNAEALYTLSSENPDSFHNDTSRLIGWPIQKGTPAPAILHDTVYRAGLSEDGTTFLLADEQQLSLLSALNPTAAPQSLINLGQWNFSVNPRGEWKNIFLDTWRLQRDFFWDPNLGQVDWQKMYDRYQPLVKRVGSRDELNDLISQMVGELETLHTFVVGGDKQNLKPLVQQGYLGARLMRNQKRGGDVVEHIYNNDPDFPHEQSPLKAAGLSIEDGDVIRKINGVSILEVNDSAELLINQAGKEVLIEYQKTAGSTTYEAIVTPLDAESDKDLRYSEWEFSRREQVEKKGQGKIGYIHLRDMTNKGYDEWVQQFYPVFRREGLIIDVRNNKGGNVDSWLLEQLLRKAWFFWKARGMEPFWNMPFAFRGHVAVICNAFTMSDGEAFTEGIRRLGIGTIIGTRTWGGEIWLSMNNRVVDRGIASASQWGVYDEEGNWIIEGVGVVPDKEVDNLPHQTFKGRDAQLDAALSVIQAKIAQEPVKIPQAPSYPNRAFTPKKREFSRKKAFSNGVLFIE